MSEDKEADFIPAADMDAMLARLKAAIRAELVDEALVSPCEVINTLAMLLLGELLGALGEENPDEAARTVALVSILLEGWLANLDPAAVQRWRVHWREITSPGPSEKLN